MEANNSASSQLEYNINSYNTPSFGLGDVGSAAIWLSKMADHRWPRPILEFGFHICWIGTQQTNIGHYDSIQVHSTLLTNFHSIQVIEFMPQRPQLLNTHLTY